MEKIQTLFIHDANRAKIYAFLRGSRIVWIVASNDTSEKAAKRATYEATNGASDIETYHGVDAGSVTMRLVPPAGKKSGRYALYECRIVLKGPTRNSRGKFPSFDDVRGWRNLYLSMQSQVLLACIAPIAPKKDSKRAKRIAKS